MWDLPRSRHALASAVAAVLAVIVIVVYVTAPHWRSAVPGTVASGGAPATTAPTQAPAQQAGSAPSATTAQVPAANQASIDPASGITVQPAPALSGQNPPAVQADTAAPAPSFDIVRVSPNGDSVVAARAAPNTDIALMDGDTVIARAKTDASGQVAFLPPALKPGEHSLGLAVGSPGSSNAASSQTVAVSVPEQGKSAPMVAVLQPNEGTKVLSGPVAGTADAGPPAAGSPAAGTPEQSVAIQSVEAEEQGSFYATGKAVPGSQCHVYLNGSFVATVTADGKGLWSLQINRGMKPGHYAVRIDQVEPKSGKVTARAEVPFDYPAAQVAAAPPAEKPRKVAAAAPVPKQVDQPVPLPPAQASKPGAARVALAGPQKGVPVSPPNPARVAPAAPVQTADASGTGGASASDADAAFPTIVDELLTARVIRGDTLWRISRKMLGHGVRYTQIYAANTQQIRNPRLIFPGQVFVLPQKDAR